MPTYFRSNSEMIARDVDGEFFIIDENGGAIHYLNQSASAIWRLLDEPATARSIISTFRFLYPDEDVASLKKSIRATLRQLSHLGVLRKQKR
jgi:hypothetical protein